MCKRLLSRKIKRQRLECQSFESVVFELKRLCVVAIWFSSNLIELRSFSSSTKSCFFDIVDSFIFDNVNSHRKSFVSLIELNHLRMLFQLDLLLERQFCWDARIGDQIDKSNYFFELSRWMTFRNSRTQCHCVSKKEVYVNEEVEDLYSWVKRTIERAKWEWETSLDELKRFKKKRYQSFLHDFFETLKREKW